MLRFASRYPCHRLVTPRRTLPVRNFAHHVIVGFAYVFINKVFYRETLKQLKDTYNFCRVFKRGFAKRQSSGSSQKGGDKIASGQMSLWLSTVWLNIVPRSHFRWASVYVTFLACHDFKVGLSTHVVLVELIGNRKSMTIFSYSQLRTESAVYLQLRILNAQQQSYEPEKLLFVSDCMCILYAFDFLIVH